MKVQLRYIGFLGFVLLGLSHLGFAETFSVSGNVYDSTDRTIQLEGMVFVKGKGGATSIEDNYYKIEGLSNGTYQLIFEIWGYESIEKQVEIDGANVVLNLKVKESAYQLPQAFVSVKREFDTEHMPDIKGTAIFASKKTEVIIPKPAKINLAVNTPRQLFNSVPGLNVWESDAGGLQLGIGSRGLNPNRTSNFNTRQNGYDISADALGYPESYYTPPSEMIKRVELVRGAASLQYGPQFGGMLNFHLYDGPTRLAMEYNGSISYGAFNYWQVFQQIGGRKNRWQYAISFQQKGGDGFRPNSQFDQTTIYGVVKYALNSKMDLKVDYTYMNYLAQQSGGLQDFQFEQDPLQSIRGRNWFKVDWNLASANLEYRISNKWKFNSKLWVLRASRMSVGELGKINRPDPMRERDLIIGEYQNIGWENRALYRYNIVEDKVRGTLSFGTRLYRGFTQNRQGFADATADPNFTFLSPNFPGISSYRFPNWNMAFFAENMFNLTKKWTLTPGFRIEGIETNAKGYYQTRLISGDEVIFRDTTSVRRSNRRAFPLFGVGSSYRFKQKLELYGNFSENYRSINFTDLAISNPNLVVDSNLQDETGFNIDLGFRGVVADGKLRFDLSVFCLSYNNRIGITEKVVLDAFGNEQLSAYRTNISNSLTKGVEFYAEWNILKRVDTLFSGSSIFVNGSWMNGRYTGGDPDYEGNLLEYVPNVGVKTGFTISYRSFGFTYQLSYTSKQYTDATNAEWVSDATRGVIPAYSIHDINLSYVINKTFTVKMSVNNLLDNQYFTRRALSYPGPGIIPASPRAWYLTLRYHLERKRR